MRSSRSVTALVAVVGLTLASAGLLAQKTTDMHKGTGGSPHVRSEWTVAGASITVEYGRPFLKGRTIGKDVVPYGQVWRAGADEATTLKTDKPLTFGSLTVPAGVHTLFVLPAADKWVLIVSKQTGQWGTQYTAGQDLGRVDMALSAAPAAAEQHTISVEPTSGGGVLQMTFGTVRASVPFSVGK